MKCRFRDDETAAFFEVDCAEKGLRSTVHRMRAAGQAGLEARHDFAHSNGWPTAASVWFTGRANHHDALPQRLDVMRSSVRKEMDEVFLFTVTRVRVCGETIVDAEIRAAAEELDVSKESGGISRIKIEQQFGLCRGEITPSGTGEAAARIRADRDWVVFSRAVVSDQPSIFEGRRGPMVPSVSMVPLTVPEPTVRSSL